jgi:hypothetical protein
MKKEGLLVLFALIAVLSVLTVTFVNASSFSSPDEAIRNAYLCLFNNTVNRTDLSLQEAVFTTLAEGYQNNTYTTIEHQRNGNCWPSSSCTLKDTSQVALAYNAIGENTSGIETWLISKNMSVTGLQWFLEIDINNHIPSACTVSDGSSTQNVQIDEDMKLSGSTGSCLTVSSDGYLLTVSPSCIDNKFTVSCDQDFITTMLYKKTGGDTVYVSSDTHGASSLGTTNEQINSKCFSLGNSCDYEGSLWAAVSLQKLGYDVTSFIPYLLALEEDNQNLLPSSFLYVLTGGQDQYSELTTSQLQNKFWQAGANNSRFYDTALAVSALSGASSNEKDNAKQYLLDIQQPNGCWNNNNVRDSAMTLWAGWPGSLNSYPGSGGNSGGTGGTMPIDTNPGNASQASQCSLAGYDCTSAFSCLDAGGTVLSSYGCPSLQSCCSVTITQQSCSALGGVVCGSNQECGGQQVPSSDGSCCTSACIDTQNQNSCETLNAGTCKSACVSGESEVSESCSAGQVCCAASGGSPSNSSSSGSSLWIWFLIGIILILAILGVVYKDKVRLWWFKLSGKLKTTPVVKSPDVQTGGIMPIQRRPLQIGGPMRPMPSSSRPAPVNRPIPKKVENAKSQKDKDFEETLRKLKDMSK